MITGYQQDVFYNLNTGAKAVALIKNWDLAFSTNALEVGIRINSVNGVNLWAVPGIDINGWATLDSAGYQSWAELHNTDSAIYYGAFNINANGSTFDFSWGVYDFNTHEVVGDSLFLIKVTDLQGNVYFKNSGSLKELIILHTIGFFAMPILTTATILLLLYQPQYILIKILFIILL